MGGHNSARRAEPQIDARESAVTSGFATAWKLAYDSGTIFSDTVEGDLDEEGMAEKGPLFT